MSFLPVLAYIINWGWLRIGPPYVYININPVIVQLGPLALRWYGLMYAVAIVMGLWAIQGYLARKGITQNHLYRIVWWCIILGLIGGRLYFVIQQPNLYSGYILQPWNILATWEGGMAFYGAIFVIIPVLIWRARVERLNFLVLIDAGVLFAAVGQIFGRIGNLINGDIIGFKSTLPWSTVYQNPQSWACLNPQTCNVPVQPAAAYELLIDIVMLIVLYSLARRVRRPGILTFVYLFSYAISQFLIFFVRDNLITSFFGLGGDLGLKQAQWTSLVVFILLIPLTYFVMRSHYAQPVPDGAVAATYGIPQKEDKEEENDEDEVVAPDDEDEQDEEQEVLTNEEETPVEDGTAAAPDEEDEEALMPTVLANAGNNASDASTQEEELVQPEENEESEQETVQVNHTPVAQGKRKKGKATANVAPASDEAS